MVLLSWQSNSRLSLLFHEYRLSAGGHQSSDQVNQLGLLPSTSTIVIYYCSARKLMLVRTSMSVLLLVGPKCTLAASSHAAIW